ncbi:MAG: hypothetical protein BGO86_00275 [Chryseobacterium sp. 36-9]|nr:MAG: hypothetical protein BGO86_00275 [Chryseobacterium sp. 36-9]
MDIELKKILLSFSMPKFIWVTEIYDSTKVVDNRVEGLLLVDATEPLAANVIGAIFENKLVISGLKTEVVHDLSASIPNIEFSSYNRNLTFF